jgi:exosome complex component MTR3
MTRNYANLSNCYKPLPFPLLSKDDDKKSVNTNNKGEEDEAALQRRDTGKSHEQIPARKSPTELRLLCLELGVTSCTGSALVELGHTKVLCEVIGPTTDISNNNYSQQPLNMEQGTLLCHVQYLPNVGYPVTLLVGASASSGLTTTETTQQQQQQQPSAGRINTQIGGHEKELANQIVSSIAAAVPLKAYPKNAIILQLTILQDDGSVLSACTIAASLALINASLEVYDMVTSCTVAVFNNNNNNNNKTSTSNSPVLMADPTFAEIAKADAIVTLSLLANWKEVTLWNQSGKLSSTLANQAISLCRDGCRTMHKLMRNALLMDDNGAAASAAAAAAPLDDTDAEMKETQ